MIFTNVSGTVAFDDSLVTAFSTEAIFANGQNNVMDAFVKRFDDIGAKAISIPTYARLPVTIGAIPEGSELAPTAMTDSKVVLTPQEHAATIMTTNLASLQTGGIIDRAAAVSIGRHWGQYMDKLALTALAGASQVLTPNDVAVTALTAGSVMTGDFLTRVYNKLERAGTPKLPGNVYAAVLHSDVITDLRRNAAAGEWIDTVKYGDMTAALTNQVSIYKGFVIVQDNQVAFGDANGATNRVDAYDSYFFGDNSIAKATSQRGKIIIQPAGDALNRFLNISWYEVTAYGIMDQYAVVRGVTSSSVGANLT